MRPLEEAVIRDCFSFLKNEKDHGEYQLTAVYYRKNSNDAVDVIACAVDTSSRSQVIAFNPYQDINIHQKTWGMDIDEYDFKTLEQGYEILYMPLDSHIKMWMDIDHLPLDNMEHTNGLQSYLLYCKQHGITKESLETLTLQPVSDVMSMYQETNQRYEIISSLDIADVSIVLGYNPNAVQPYVVWECDKDRKFGYRTGMYRTEKADAIKVFEGRCKDHLEQELNFKFKVSRTKKERDYNER